MLAGIALMVAGFYSCLASPARPPADSPEEIGHRIGEDIALFVLGVIVLAVGKLGAWWHHG